MFWLACEELKRETDPDAVEEKARFIYEDYISILSPKEVSPASSTPAPRCAPAPPASSDRVLLQVSLDSRVREIVNRNMVEPTPHTFDEAQLQIYTLMHRDSYPRFVNSPLYKTLARLSSAEPPPSAPSAATAHANSTPTAPNAPTAPTAPTAPSAAGAPGAPGAAPAVPTPAASPAQPVSPAQAQAPSVQ